MCEVAGELSVIAAPVVMSVRLELVVVRVLSKERPCIILPTYAECDTGFSEMVYLAYRPKRVGFGLVGFVPGSAVVEVGPVNCGSPPVDLGLCLGAVAGLVELVNDLLVGERGFKDVCWGGRELGVQVAPPQHGLDLVIKTHATVGS